MAQFNDPAAYERYMGGWSRAAGEQFLDWLGQPHGLRWLDNGYGSGIFSELLWQQALPARLDGIDISPELLAHARQRLPQRITLHHGDANALPFAAGSFDAAAMALVIVFLADALQAVREMQRVVRSGGMVATYSHPPKVSDKARRRRQYAFVRRGDATQYEAFGGWLYIWDLPHGFPYADAFAALRDCGVLPDRAASDETTALAQLQALWEQAGLQEVETCAFTVAQRYPDFAVYWQALADSASIGARFAALSADMQAAVRAALQKRLPAAPDGSILVTARAHAAKGIRA